MQQHCAMLVPDMTSQLSDQCLLHRLAGARLRVRCYCASLHLQAGQLARRHQRQRRRREAPVGLHAWELNLAHPCSVSCSCLLPLARRTLPTKGTLQQAGTAACRNMSGALEIPLNPELAWKLMSSVCRAVMEAMAASGTAPPSELWDRSSATRRGHSCGHSGSSAGACIRQSTVSWSRQSRMSAEHCRRRDKRLPPQAQALGRRECTTCTNEWALHPGLDARHGSGSSTLPNDSRPVTPGL
jgi:hypothetical protein